MHSWIDNARIFAAFAVVLLHTAASYMVISESGSLQWFYSVLVDSGVRWCVPVFVMISGALLLDPAKNESLADFYGKRVARILVPMFSWTFIYLVWKGLKLLRNNHLNNVFDLFTEIPYYHLWYLYMIAFLYVFTPFIRKLTSNLRRKELFWLIMMLFFLATINSCYFYLFEGTRSELFLNWFLPYFPYYLAGHFVKEYSVSISSLSLSMISLLLILLTSVICFSVTGTYGFDLGQMVMDYLSITIIPLSICVFLLIKKARLSYNCQALVKSIASLAFGIYLIHPMLLDILKSISPYLFTLNPLFGIFAVGSCVFLCSMSAIFLIKFIPFVRRIV